MAERLLVFVQSNRGMFKWAWVTQKICKYVVKECVGADLFQKDMFLWCLCSNCITFGYGGNPPLYNEVGIGNIERTLKNREDEAFIPQKRKLYVFLIDSASPSQSLWPTEGWTFHITRTFPSHNLQKAGLSAYVNIKFITEITLLPADHLTINLIDLQPTKRDMFR